MLQRWVTKMVLLNFFLSAQSTMKEAQQNLKHPGFLFTKLYKKKGILISDNFRCL